MSPLKTITLVILVLAAGTIAALHFRSLPQSDTPMQDTNKTITLRIGTTTVVAEIADTEPLRAQGLGNRAQLEEGRGMWFVFEEDGLYSFWMKDTLIPLDMIWVDASGAIVTIAHNVKPESYPDPYAPTAPARYVLEVPGEWSQKVGIAEGQKVVVQ